MAQYSLNTPYLLLTGSLLIAVMLGAVVYRPLYTSWQDLQQQVTTTNQHLQERQQFLANIDRQKNELGQLQQYENELAVVLPNNDRIEDIYRILHEAGNTSGVFVDSLDNTSDKDQANVLSARARGETVTLPNQVLPVGIAMQIHGTYQQLRSFLDILDKTPRLVSVISLDANHDTSTSDQITTKMQLEFFKRNTNTK